MGCPETSVTNYQFTLHKISDSKEFDNAHAFIEPAILDIKLYYLKEG
jgi:hypothetical protein